VIKELRKENAKYRLMLKETNDTRAEELANQKLEALRAEVEAKANSTAKEIMEKELAERDRVSKARQVKQELRHHAERAGVSDFNDLFEIMSKDLDSKVKFSNDGEVKNASELIAEIKAAKPYLFVQSNTSSNAEQPPMKTDTNTDFESMDREQFIGHLRAMGVKIPGYR
jgi:soluble cytochrome b562